MDMSHARLTGVPDPDLGHRRLRDQQIRRLQRISHAPIFSENGGSAIELIATNHDQLGGPSGLKKLLEICHLCPAARV